MAEVGVHPWASFVKCVLQIDNGDKENNEPTLLPPGVLVAILACLSLTIVDPLFVIFGMVVGVGCVGDGTLLRAMPKHNIHWNHNGKKPTESHEVIYKMQLVTQTFNGTKSYTYEGHNNSRYQHINNRIMHLIRLNRKLAIIWVLG